MHILPKILTDLAPTGVLRVAINYGNPVLAKPHPMHGTPTGVSAELAEEIASRLGVPYRYETYDAAGKVFAALGGGDCDIGFLAIDPVRAEGIRFTEPYVEIEGTYLVRHESRFQRVEDVDADGVRIAVGRGAAYDLHLSRELRHARLERAETSVAAIDLFVENALDAAAGVRQPLLRWAAEHPGYRVLEGRFTTIRQAVAIPANRSDATARLLHGMVEDIKSTAFVRTALERGGETAVTVVPPLR
jgi:polar amino acid transport system substrate-binding protein